MATPCTPCTSPTPVPLPEPSPTCHRCERPSGPHSYLTENGVHTLCVLCLVAVLADADRNGCRIAVLVSAPTEVPS